MSAIFAIARHSFKELVRKKDFYVLLFLFAGLAFFFYNETFFGVEDTSRYLKDIGFSIIILFSMVIAVSFSAKQIPSETESKTIYPLLAKPVSRTSFILGKFLGSLLISIIAFSVFYALYLGAIMAKGEGVGIVLILQSYLFSVLLLMFLSAISIFFSLFLTISANFTITFILYFFAYWYNDSLKDMILSSSGKVSYLLYSALYYLIPHFEFYDTRIRLVHLWDPLPLWVVASVTVYTVIYVSLVTWLANTVFKRKSL